MNPVSGLLPTSCRDLQTSDGSLLDGYFRFHVLSPVDGSTIGEVTLYCVMSTTPAKSFLPLPAGRDTNYASRDTRFNDRARVCDNFDLIFDSHGRTEFDMIKVIPATQDKVGIKLST